MGWSLWTRFEDKNFGEWFARPDVLCSLENVHGYVRHSGVPVIQLTMFILTGGSDVTYDAVMM